MFIYLVSEHFLQKPCPVLNIQLSLGGVFMTFNLLTAHWKPCSNNAVECSVFASHLMVSAQEIPPTGLRVNLFCFISTC